MSNFNLDDFLANYKPKKVNLEPYLKLDKLKNYKWMEHEEDKQLLKPNRTYIKYIKMGDAHKDKNYQLHVRGGILLAGGTYINGTFHRLVERLKWTHLMLRFSPFPSEIKRSAKGHGQKKLYDYDHHTFCIKINDYYIFYKYFQRG